MPLYEILLKILLDDGGIFIVGDAVLIFAFIATIYIYVSDSRKSIKEMKKTIRESCEKGEKISIKELEAEITEQIKKLKLTQNSREKLKIEYVAKGLQIALWKKGGKSLL